MSQNTFEFNYKRLLSSHILCSISMLTYYYTSSSSPEFRVRPQRTELHTAWRPLEAEAVVSKLRLRMSGQAFHAPLALFTFSIEYKSKSSFSNTHETNTLFWHKFNWSYKTMHFRAASAAK